MMFEDTEAEEETGEPTEISSIWDPSGFIEEALEQEAVNKIWDPFGMILPPVTTVSEDAEDTDENEVEDPDQIIASIWDPFGMI